MIVYECDRTGCAIRQPAAGSSTPKYWSVWEVDGRVYVFCHQHGGEIRDAFTRL